jgi:hypothetical protein
VASLVAVSLVGLLGVVAIALEGGLLFETRRHIQAAADAAALAAATDLYENYLANKGADPDGNATKSAKTTAAANGYSSTNATVTVNIPPKSGPFKGNTKGYAEVIIQHSEARSFSRIWDSADIVVSARAVARPNVNPPNIGLLLLDPSMAGALTAKGNGAVVVTGGGMAMIDSSASDAIQMNGNGAASAPEINIVGNPGYQGGTLTGKINSGAAYESDPLAALPAPDTAGMATYTFTDAKGSQTLQPGRYTGGISATQAAITLSPGIYYLDGGLNLSGRASISGTGVMIYSTNGSISMTGQGNVSLSPPTTGTYQGMSIFQDRSSTASISLKGSSNLTITGVFYAPSAAVDLVGNGGCDASGNPIDVIGSVFIADSLTLKGNGNVSVQSNSGPTPLRKIQLVE